MILSRFTSRFSAPIVTALLFLIINSSFIFVAQADFYGGNSYGSPFQNSGGSFYNGGFGGGYGGGGFDNGLQDVISLELNPQKALNSSFRVAARESRLDRMEEDAKRGADINSTSASGWTALMNASRNCKVKAVAKLVELKADVNLRDREGRTALMLATASSCVDIVKILVKVPNVDLDVKEYRTGFTAIAYAEQTAIMEVGGEASEIIRILKRAKAHRPIAKAQLEKKTVSN